MPSRATARPAIERPLNGSSERDQFGWPLAVPDRPDDRPILELLLRAHVAQQQAAAAHVPTPDELRREQQALAKHIDERVSVLARRDAAEQYDCVGLREGGGELLDVATQRSPVARAGAGDVDFRERHEVPASDDRLWREEAPVGRDHVR